MVVKAAAKPNPRRPDAKKLTIRSGPKPSSPNGESRFKTAATLNEKQDRFVQEYLINPNATQAAMKAGYSAKTAHAQGHDLLKHPEVSRRLEAGRAKLADRYEVTQDRVVRELALLGFSNMADYMKTGKDGEPVLDLSDLTRDQAAALQEITVEEFKDGRSDKREVRRVKFKLAEKRTALELLGRNLGMFTEKHDHTHQHQHLVMHTLLAEIDAESRARPLIEDGGAVVDVPGPGEVDAA